MAEKGMEAEKVGWRERLKEELTPQRNLVYLKIVLTMHNFGLAFVLPFVTLHMRQLGITYKELAAIFTFTPLTAVLGPPVAGMVADKTGRYKSVLFFNNVMMALMTVLLLYVPARPIRALTLTYGSEGHNLTWSYCDLCHDERNNTFQDFTLQDCEFTCSTPPGDMKMCFDNGQQQSFYDISKDSKVALNGTILTSQDDQTCSQSFTEVTYQGQLYRDLTCPSPCPVTCQVTSPSPCHDPRDPSNSLATFWIYMAVRLLWNLFGISAGTMMNAITMAILKERGGELGKQKVLPVIAYSIAPFISGAIVDWHSASLGYSDFTPAFYIAGFVMLLSAFLITRLDFTPDRPQQRMIKDLKKLVTKVDVNAFIILVFLLGSNWGFLETFLFVHLKSLDAPNSLMGATVLVSNIFAIPVIFLCDKIIDKIGYNAVFIFSFFVYAFREFTYSLFSNPVAIVCLESVKVLAYNFPWNAMVRLCPDLAPKGLLATMSGIAFSVHHTFGWSAGSVLGGTMVSSLGLPKTFRAFSYISLTCGVGYLVLYLCYIRRRRTGHKEEDVEERDPMMLTVAADNLNVSNKQADNNDIKPSDNNGEAMDVTRRTDNTSTPADNLNTTVTTSDNNAESRDITRPTDNTYTAADNPNISNKQADNNEFKTSDNTGEPIDNTTNTDNISTAADNVATPIDNTDSEIPDTTTTITTINDISTTPNDTINTTDNPIKSTDTIPITTDTINTPTDTINTTDNTIKSTDATTTTADTINTLTNTINTTDNTIKSTDTTTITPDTINTPTDTTNTTSNNST